ncbi:aminotransferase class I/II-fold pyridoxal phosphate-dependent enzyme [Candidatus Nitrosotenuis chungbukensis]|uniref:aminotransferase class I/II-fold pyridoxal phosphate-dependent enzyme n=1 Tax=Candidatus Nitrosotenuis chungbukensis TaxID=1353246 RepID=UPI000A9B339D|nr:aminotransferase class I/II-fold pyridoxal phosphate-dependent enzyme [Candidatus Nitrosotenuis chungbukensis]
MSNIDQLRNKIDSITLEMLTLLKERTDIAKQIGELKKSSGLNVTDEAREEQLRKEVSEFCKRTGLDESLGKKLLNFLLNESIKVQSDGKQTHLTVFLKAKSLEQQGKKIIHMEVGEPDFAPPKTVRDALGEAFDKGFVRYGPAAGIPQFRSALAKYATEKFGAAITPENILVSPGARFSIYLAINTLLNPGDEMIVIEPAWPAYRDCAINAGVKVRTIPTTLESRWEPTVSQIEKTINENTKMIILNYPNNPTGKILPPKLQEEIIRIAEKNDLYVLSDEIYSSYSFSDWKSVLSYRYKKSIVTQSFSKSHAMTGFRIGYAVADPKIIEKMAKLQALCLTNVAEPIQYAALKALDADVTPNAKNVRSKIDTVVNEARKMGLEFAVPDGAMYLFARVNKQGFDGVEFSNLLLDHGVAVAPGDGFGNYKGFIRISACQDEKKLMDGMKILDEVLNKSK